MKKKMPSNNRRKLIRLEVTDAEKRRFPSKHYSYVIKVSWSDDSETVIFRRYSKFFDFQIILLETFPNEGGLKDPSARIIPFLPGKILFRRSHVRDVAMKRLKPIDEYCKALIRLPAHISESDHVLDFFETKQEDLNPVREEGQRRRKKDDQDIGEISGPLLLEQYISIADYISTQSKELSLTTGQQVEVIEKNENGWWFVSDDEGERGWVPGVYLEKPDGSVEDLVTNQAEPGKGEHYVAIHAHTAENSDEINLSVGVVVEVLQKNLEGWWLVRYNGKEGYAPASYLEKSHNWVQENKRPVQIISSIHELRHRHSLPTSSLSTIGYPSQRILNSRKNSDISNTPNMNDSPSPIRPEVTSPTSKTTHPPPKRSSVKRVTKKRPDGPPPLPPTAVAESTYEYMTVAPFNADIPDGVSFSEEKKVDVLEKSPGGWWYIKIDGSEGWAPASYIEKREKPQRLKVNPPIRPNPPKLMKNNSTGNLGISGKPTPPKSTDKGNISNPMPFRLPTTVRSQSVMSPAKRPLPPLPTSASESRISDTETKTYEEVESKVIHTIEEELPVFRTPPLPPGQEKKPSPEHVSKPPIRPNQTPVNKDNDPGPVDFRSVLKSSIIAKHNEIKSKPVNSPPRPPTKPGSTTADSFKGKPQQNGLMNKPKVTKVLEKPASQPKNVNVKTNDVQNSPGSVKKPSRPPKFQQELPPKLPPKPKPSLNMPANKLTPVLRANVQSSDDGAIVDFRSVLRSTQRKQSTGSNGVGRSKSFNSDKIISAQGKNQQNKPPSVPKKPTNMPLKPLVPSKMKELDSNQDGVENIPKPSSIRNKPNGKPFANGNKPVLRRFQTNNSNSNVGAEESKPKFTVGHLQIELTNPPDLGSNFMKRGSPDGQVDEKFGDSKDAAPATVVPPERLKKLPKSTKQDVDFTAVVSELGMKKEEQETEQKEASMYVAVSDYQGLEECEISFVCGQKAQVLEKAENNWWYVDINGTLGWAPSSFFQLEETKSMRDEEVKPEENVEGHPNSQHYDDSLYSEIDTREEGHCFPACFKAAADFQAAEPSMLDLHTGEEVTVTQEAEGGWWFAVSADGTEGWVPSSYLDPI